MWKFELKSSPEVKAIFAGYPDFVQKKMLYLRELVLETAEKTPDQYAMYFQCTTRLVDTFKMVFGPKFQFEGNRAIIFPIDQNIPVLELKECIRATLTYHKVKHLLMLGM